MDGITKETFREIKDTNTKLDILFDLLSNPDRRCNSIKSLETEVVKLKTSAARWGGIGGIITAIGAYLASLFLHNMTK